MKNMRTKAPYLYLAAIVWVIILGLLLKFAHLNVTGLGITLTFLTAIFIPGICLWRIIQPNSSTSAAKNLYIIGLGFSLYFFVNLLGLLFNLSLNWVLILTILLLVAVFCLAFWFDRKAIFEFEYKNLIRRSWADWLLWGLIVAGSLIAFFSIDAQSDRLIGDGWYHLAILQKITSGYGLAPENLTLVKNQSLSLVYSFPIWHIFVGEISQFCLWGSSP